MQTAEMFEQGIRPSQVAEALRVSVKSAYAWHRAWQAGGTAALASKGRPVSGAGWARPSCSSWRPSWTPVPGRRDGLISGGRWTGSPR